MVGKTELTTSFIATLFLLISSPSNLISTITLWGGSKSWTKLLLFKIVEGILKAIVFKIQTKKPVRLNILFLKPFKLVGLITNAMKSPITSFKTTLKLISVLVSAKSFKVSIKAHKISLIITLNILT